MNKTIAIAIHGGAGTLDKAGMTDAMKLAFEAGLRQAITAGHDILKKGGSALDAVEAAVMALEDDTLFNAGRGAVLTSEGRHEMDAAIMDGATLAAGAVAGVYRIKNPVALARKVIDNSKYVFLAGKGAMQFAADQGVATEPDAYFFTEHRLEELKKDQEEEKGLAPKKFGTVGAVAIDAMGNLAAATSTGGLTNKRYGRVGDTPLIGAGTYANNATCAVSCTGEGEQFIQAVMAYDISCLMEYKGLSLQEAASTAMNGKLRKVMGSGGFIAVDKNGHIHMEFNTEGMYRASICGNDEPFIAIFE